MLTSQVHVADARPPHHAAPLAGQGVRYEARLALDPITRRDVYSLRYRSYVAAGHIELNEAGLFSDIYDEMPNCKSIVIYQDGVAAASVRTCTLASGSAARSPAADTYPNEVRELLSEPTGIGHGRRGIETTRLVRSPEAENNQGLVFLLYRMAGYIGMMNHTQVLFACVRQNHVPFYRRLGYAPVTEPKPYPGLTCPMQLLVCTRERYDQVREAFTVIDPYAGTTGALDGFFSGEPVALRLKR